VISKSDPNLVALMARFNRGGKLEWCIPKGHLEQNETSEQAALREVFEETGLEAEIISQLGEVNYQFIQDGARISKTVHVYLMQQTGGELSFEHDPHKEASELDWVPAVNAQASKRCHRIGQSKPVIVRSFALANSVDEIVARTLGRKAQMISEALD
jgi:8-oxo-dGTP pyrophosphatase MutT (NUDIX family)